jgi:hypothetical protein
MPSKIVTILRQNEVKVFGELAKFVLARIKWPQRLIPFPYKMRVFFSEIAPTNPLNYNKKDLDMIDVVIPCIEKDFELLDLCIEAIIRNSLNPINRILIVTNSQLADRLTNKYRQQISVIFEENCIPEDVMNYVRQIIPRDKQGWVIKQILGMFMAHNSKVAGLLVLDADTILLGKRLFLDSGKQILFPVVEFNLWDSVTTEKTWPFLKSLPISFTAHHILLQPGVVRNMFAELGGLELGIKKWLAATFVKDTWNPISDMHSYGTWLMRFEYDKVFLAKWKNLRVSRQYLESHSQNSPRETYNSLALTFRDYMSISFHHYLKPGFIGLE